MAFMLTAGSALEHFLKEAAELNGDEPYTITEHPLTARHKFPGLHPILLDSNGMYSAVKLMMFMTLPKAYYEEVPRKDGTFFLDWPKLLNERLLFAASCEFTYSRSLYDHKISKALLHVKKYMRHIGNKSIAVVIEANLPNEDNSLIKNTFQVVIMNPNTRQPEKLPGWFLEKFKGQDTQEGGIKLEPLQKPVETFVHHVQVGCSQITCVKNVNRDSTVVTPLNSVVWSDTDANNHVNYSMFAQYALDGLHRAIRIQKPLEANTDNADGNNQDTSSPLCGITEEIVKNGLKHLRVTYLKECLDGDALDVHVWQDPGELFIVKSVIEKDGQSCCYVTFEYYTPMSNL